MLTVICMVCGKLTFNRLTEGFRNFLRPFLILWERVRFAMKKQEDRFGIDIIRYCRDHEAFLQERLAAGDDPAQLLAWHEQKLSWLQHERLIHFLVTMLTAGVFLFLVFLNIYMKGSLGVLLFAALFFCLLAAYLFHYFRLENTVQHWYVLAERLHERVQQTAEK